MGLGFGLGNLWRFPYVVYENGGGAFVLLYLFLAFVIGVPLLTSELLVGKIKRKPVVSALESLSSEGQPFWDISNEEAPWVKKLLKNMGRLSIFVTLLVLTYFAVISGWVLKFFIQFFNGLFVDDFNGATILIDLKASGLMQTAFAAIHILIVSLLSLRDKDQEKERWVGFLMPAFALFIIILAFESLTLESTEKALKYLFYPDFSKLTIASPAEAIGHLLFTLSVGFGAIITLGCYLPKKSHVPGASLQVVLIDTVVSVFAGLMIFPMVMSSPIIYSGPELLFQSLPNLFSQINNGVFFGMLFFFCLYIAALGSSIGLLETVVENLMDRLKWTRIKSVIICAICAIVVAVIPAFSSTLFSDVFVDMGGLLKLWDKVLINWLLPLLALVFGQVVVYKMDKKQVEKEFMQSNSLVSRNIYNHWKFLMKTVVPLIIILALLLQLLSVVR